VTSVERTPLMTAEVSAPRVAGLGMRILSARRTPRPGARRTHLEETATGRRFPHKSSRLLKAEGVGPIVVGTEPI
jgi:hypothetical protein